MNWIFLSIIFGGLISLFFTPLFIKIQRKRKIGQSIRIDGPKSHSTKSGTPTMGGIVFIVAALISYAGVSIIKFYRHDVFSYEGIFVVSVFLMCGLIGFIDDYMSLRKQRSLGLRGWVKILLLVIVCIYFFLVAKYVINLDTSLSIPLTSLKFQLGNWYYIIPAIIIISTTNAVNLTDGLDGLAAGSASIVLAIFCFIAFLEWTISNVSFGIDIAVICGAAIAACAAFLWWNTAPAEIFMGDTGSFGLGGLIAAVAIILKQEILLLIIGGLFVLETLSVIIQVIWFKIRKKRVFKMAPLHHHFELLGWAEIKVIIRFWIVCVLFSGVGFFIYYFKFLD
ncbi:MAG: phospho-N-acetylmuramoyl-pentapeptide-transferase [Actinobacteria bacterium]|nr:phospho-N-acetylmuramoyl-pentapeptide-transferase [Actinomycetota bacterium]MCL5070898.1 phospho-N-acetylmuramoyl-pentapeptide-transferase [Actinomycetota bacterium]